MNSVQVSVEVRRHLVIQLITVDLNIDFRNTDITSDKYLCYSYLYELNSGSILTINYFYFISPGLSPVSIWHLFIYIMFSHIYFISTETTRAETSVNEWLFINYQIILDLCTSLWGQCFKSNILQYIVIPVHLEYIIYCLVTGTRCLIGNVLIFPLGNFHSLGNFIESRNRYQYVLTSVHSSICQLL